MAVALASGPAYAQYTDGVVKIGVLTDMSSLYADNTGPGSVAAAKLAVADFGAEAKGIKVGAAESRKNSFTKLEKK
jgi:branched-chain amino acid transport system substrate-binding protein